MQQPVGGQRTARARPEAVAQAGEPSGTGAAPDRAEVEHRVMTADLLLGDLLGRRRRARRLYILELPAFPVDVERHQEAEDHLSVLQRVHVARGERTPVAIAVDAEDRRVVGASGPQEVAVERVQEAPVGNREARSARGLCRDLAAVQVGEERLRWILRAEEVTIELLEVEEPQQVLDVPWFHHAVVVDAAR